MFSLKRIKKNFVLLIKLLFLESRIIGILYSLAGHKSNIVCANNDLVIEGFPRSGNTFTYHYIKELNPELNVAHHLHTIDQINRAKENGVTCVVVFRDPLEVIASIMAVDRLPYLSLAMIYYVRYHKALLGKENVILVDFNDVTNNMKDVIYKVNQVAGLSLTNSDRSGFYEVVKRRVRRSNIGNLENLVAIPDNNKSKIKDLYRSKISNHFMFSKAESLYQDLVKKAI